MKWFLLLGAVAALAAAVAVLANRLAAAGDPRFRRLGRTAWLVSSSVLLVLFVYAAHALGMFSVPLVAVAFVVVGIPARWLFLAMRPRRPRKPAPAPTALGRHEIVVLTVLVSGVAIVAAFVGVLVATH